MFLGWVQPTLNFIARCQTVFAHKDVKLKVENNKSEVGGLHTGTKIALILMGNFRIKCILHMYAKELYIVFSLNMCTNLQTL